METFIPSDSNSKRERGQLGSEVLWTLSSMLRGKMRHTTVTFEFYKKKKKTTHTHHHLQTTTVTGIKTIKKCLKGSSMSESFDLQLFQFGVVVFFCWVWRSPKLESRKVNHFQSDTEKPLNGELGNKVTLTPKPNLAPDPSGERLTDQLINLLTSCGDK